MTGYNGPALHTFEPDADGRCQGGWVASNGDWHECRSTQRSSVLHDDPEAAFRERHWHGGGDCMCFEADDGPSYEEDEPEPTDASQEGAFYRGDGDPSYRAAMTDAGRGGLLR